MTGQPDLTSVQAPILLTDRLQLRRVERQDLPGYYQLFADEDVMRYSDGTMTPADVDRWFDQLQHRGAGKEQGWIWSVLRRSDLQLLGYCSLRPSPHSGYPELGYRLLPSYWHHGYASEAAQAAMDFGFSQQAMSVIGAQIDPHNLRSLKVAQRLGMQLERTVMPAGFDYPDQIWVKRTDCTELTAEQHAEGDKQ